VVRGGDKPNIIPSWAEADLIFRTVEDPTRVLDRLRGIVEKHGGRIDRWWGNEPMLMAVPDGAESVVVAFNTDVPHLRALGRPLLFGPGSILDAHTAGEKVAKSHLRNAVSTYVDLVGDLLAGKVR
jgi:acetylornithine deacetylase